MLYHLNSYDKGPVLCIHTCYQAQICYWGTSKCWFFAIKYFLLPVFVAQDILLSSIMPKVVRIKNHFWFYDDKKVRKKTLCQKIIYDFMKKKFSDFMKKKSFLILWKKRPQLAHAAFFSHKIKRWFFFNKIRKIFFA